MLIIIIFHRKSLTFFSDAIRYFRRVQYDSYVPSSTNELINCVAHRLYGTKRMYNRIHCLSTMTHTKLLSLLRILYFKITNYKV